jgi:hypothetical protein
MRPTFEIDDEGIFRWKTNRAVVPPQWLEDAGVVFAVADQQRAFSVMAVRFADQYPPDTDSLTAFVDYSLGRLILKPALGEANLKALIEDARTGWRNRQ